MGLSGTRTGKSYSVGISLESFKMTLWTRRV